MRVLFPEPGSLPLIPPLLGRLVSPLPLLPLELVLNRFLRRVVRRNPQIFDRLGPHAGKRFGVRPTDLPFAFMIEAAVRQPRLSVLGELPGGLDACISAPLLHLLALLEGRLDGDALMFSRELLIEGDVEAVLALRNAIDDARLDLTDEIGSLFGPLGEAVRRILGLARDSVLQSGRRQDEVNRWS